MSPLLCHLKRLTQTRWRYFFPQERLRLRRLRCKIFRQLMIALLMPCMQNPLQMFDLRLQCIEVLPQMNLLR